MLTPERNDMPTHTPRRKPALQPPIERLFDSALRLNQQRELSALHEAIVDEATSLLGAQRVLLVLQTQTDRQIAGKRLPARENAGDLLQAITPWLDEAHKTRASRLRHGPEGADAQQQRSCLVAPLVARCGGRSATPRSTLPPG